MTRGEAIKIFNTVLFFSKCDCPKEDIEECLKMAIKALKQEPTPKNDLEVDCISRQAVLEGIAEWIADGYADSEADCSHISSLVTHLPSVTPQEPKTGHCKDCKWWKDSDGAYRRGIGAESQCPINSKEVFEGNGYCYMFEPQESEDKV